MDKKEPRASVWSKRGGSLHPPVIVAADAAALKGVEVGEGDEREASPSLFRRVDK